jgi:ribonucleoside-triphosphate reductase
MDRYLNIIDDYLNKEDISRHNSNLIYSVPSMNAIVHGAVSKDYWFERVYNKDIQKCHNEGLVYVHNLDVLGPYCCGFSAVDIAMKGLNSKAPNALETDPPKHVHSLLGQASNFITMISQEIHGACAINDLTTVVASYWFVEKELFNHDVTYQDICNAWQHFIFEVNLAFRSGNSSFSNITMKPDGPDVALKNDMIVFAGKHLFKGQNITCKKDKITIDKEYKYKDVPKKYYQDTNKAFIDMFKTGDAKGRIFTFPLLTINIDDDFDFEDPIFNYLLEEMDGWGGCYFENYRTTPFDEDSKFKKLNKYIQSRNPELQKSFCCRFQVGLEEILKINSSIFRSGSGVGGIGVFNINLNRIGYIAQGNWTLYYDMLTFLLETCQKTAQEKRQFILDHLELYPYWSYYNESLDSYYNVMSICGGNESIINMGIEKGLSCKEGIEKGAEIATFIRSKIEEFIKRDRVPVSLEYAPAESAAPKLAKSDIKFMNWLSLDKHHNGLVYDETYTIFFDIIDKQYATRVFFAEN